MFIVLGLGNPGREYQSTRHNVGFMTLDILADRYNIDVCRSNFRSVFGEGRIGAERVVHAKPDTFMNNSGWAARDLVNWYKCENSELIVIYDDIDIPIGTLRIREGGSSGTHNGMRSIIGETGLTAFPRIRVGIRDEEVNIPIINYVLSEVRKDDYELFASVCRKAGEAAAEFARGSSIEAVMNKFNGGDKA